MSITLGNETIQVKKILDPRLDINKSKSYEFLSGVNSCIWKNINANSSSNTAITFSYKPSQSVILSRRMYIKYKLRCTLSGTSSGFLVKIGIDDALRAFPLQTCSSSVKLKLNGSELQLSNSANSLPMLMRYANFYDQSLDYSSCPSMVDQYQNYDQYTTLGSNRNVLAKYGENTLYQPRGALEYVQVSNTATDAVFDIDVVEPLFLPTLLFSHKKQGPGFSNVQDLNLTFTLSDINRAWSHSNAGGSTVNSISVQIGGGTGELPQLLFSELTPDATIADSLTDLNRMYLYPFKNLQNYVYDNQSGTQAITAGSNFTTSVNSIQVGKIPTAIYLCVQEKLQDKQAGNRRYLATDTFARIRKIGFSVNGAANIMTEALPEQIYQVCQENGLQDSYTAFSNYVGSSVLLQVGKDIPLPVGMAPSQSQNFNFQFTTIECQNTSTTTKNYEIVVVFVFDSIFGITSTMATQTDGLLNTETILNAPVVSGFDYSSPVYGASFFGDLWSGVKDAGRGALNVGKNILGLAAPALAPALAPLASQLIKPLASKLLGVGRKAKKGGLKMAGRVRKGKGLTGDFYYGSGINATRPVGYMDREELQNRLNDYEEDEEEEQYDE
jgi:hypothetical protein